MKAANRGVRVKVLVPENSNHVVADWIPQAYYDELIDAGIEIWRYKHAMIMRRQRPLMDAGQSGTANIDRLSMYGNFEINMQFISKEYAKHMEHIFKNDLTTSYKLDPAEWRQMTRHPTRYRNASETAGCAHLGERCVRLGLGWVGWADRSRSGLSARGLVGLGCSGPFPGCTCPRSGARRSVGLWCDVRLGLSAGRLALNLRSDPSASRSGAVHFRLPSDPTDQKPRNPKLWVCGFWIARPETSPTLSGRNRVQFRRSL